LKKSILYLHFFFQKLNLFQNFAARDVVENIPREVPEEIFENKLKIMSIDRIAPECVKDLVEWINKMESHQEKMKRNILIEMQKMLATHLEVTKNILMDFTNSNEPSTSRPFSLRDQFALPIENYENFERFLCKLEDPIFYKKIVSKAFKFLYLYEF
jgi:hypothetical protein